MMGGAAAPQDEHGPRMPMGGHRSPRSGRYMHGDSAPLASKELPGVPTVSGLLDPGPYHEANAMLRRQLDHYNVRIQLRTSICTSSNITRLITSSPPAYVGHSHLV